MKAIASLLFIALTACAADNGNPATADPPAQAAAPAAESPAVPAPASTPSQPTATAVVADPGPAAPAPAVAIAPVREHELPKAVAGGAPGRVDTSCATRADCAVKDVGNCCGYFPACVNRDSPVFPEQVRAACEAGGRASICGFREITDCECIEGKCEAAGVPDTTAQ